MSAPSWAVPGAKVVCVNGRPWPHGSDFYQCLPLERHIYTIVSRAEFCLTFKVWRVRLAGLPNYSRYGTVDAGWAVDRFRPVVSKTIEDDMEHFLPLLNTVGEDA